MKWFNDWIKNNKIIVWIIIIIPFLPLGIIHILFKLDFSSHWFEVEWSSGDVLAYVGNVISFWGTVFLGIVAIKQSQQANTLSQKMLEIESNSRMPCFDIINYQVYNIFLCKSIEDVINEFDLENTIRFLIYRKRNPKTQVIKRLCIIKAKITNSGGSDIKRIYITEAFIDLDIVGQIGPDQLNAEVEGNTNIKKGETRNLLLDIGLEVPLFTNYEGELERIEKKLSSILPHFSFCLQIVSTDGYSYQEEIECFSGYYVNMKNELDIMERFLVVDKLEIKKME